MRYQSPLILKDEVSAAVLQQMENYLISISQPITLLV